MISQASQRSFNNQHSDPGGMLLVGRNWKVGDEYRYGFNGKESDMETYGDGNVYDYGFRIYNRRLGKFLSIDPFLKKFPSLTPFTLAFNSTLLFMIEMGKVLNSRKMKLITPSLNQ